jgi:hypothetical protein
MRLVHIELSELERTRSFPYSSSLYAPIGTEDASLLVGHKHHEQYALTLSCLGSIKCGVTELHKTRQRVLRSN